MQGHRRRRATQWSPATPISKRHHLYETRHFRTQEYVCRGLGVPACGSRALSDRPLLHFAQMKAAPLRDEKV